MSHLADAIAAERPDWGPLPDALLQAFDWMQQHGLEQEIDGAVYATAYPGQRPGVVFRSGLDLDGWYEPAAARHLLPLAEANGAGGVVALWRDPDAGPAGDPPVVLIDGLGQTRLADNALELLRLVAIGYDELVEFAFGDLPPADSAAVHRDFRAWVQGTFGVAVPEVWDPVQHDDFTDWSNAQRGEPASARSSTENPDAAAGHAEVGGPITRLLDLLGETDDEHAAGVVSELAGVDLGRKLKSATRKLDAAGLAVATGRGLIETIWIQLGPPRSIGFNIPPSERPLWAGPTLIDGLDGEPTPEQVRAALGEPESEGEEYLRYRVGGRFLHLGFGETDRLASVTLMTTVP